MCKWCPWEIAGRSRGDRPGLVASTQVQRRPGARCVSAATVASCSLRRFCFGARDVGCRRGMRRNAASGGEEEGAAHGSARRWGGRRMRCPLSWRLQCICASQSEIRVQSPACGAAERLRAGRLSQVGKCVSARGNGMPGHANAATRPRQDLCDQTGRTSMRVSTSGSLPAPSRSSGGSRLMP